jgi:hypothetical protein
MYQIEDLVAREIQNDYRQEARQSRLAAQARSFQPLQLIRRVLIRIERLFAKMERHPRPLSAQSLSQAERLHRI